ICDRVTLELHHGGMFENGVYKGGKVCYLDNVVDDFLSLLDLRKIGKELGYTIDVSKIEQTMEIRYRKAGEKDGNILELITSDSKVVEMVGCMPCNRVLVLYYTDLENSNGNGLGTQASAAWPSLDSAEYNYDADVENHGKGVTLHAFNEPGDADAYVEVGNEEENEVAATENGEENKAAATENGEVGNEGENEENDAQFVDSDYEFSEQEDEVLVAENVVVEGASGEANAGENIGPSVQANADKSEATFVIKTMSLEHTCGRVDKLKYASSKWICNRYSKKLKRDTDLDVKSLQEDVLDDYCMNVTRHQIYRAKKRAKLMIEGSYKEQYARLRDYAEELKKANKGSTVVIQTEQVGAQAIFLRMYVCLAVIGLDGCHVKGPYPGQILTAVGVDGNNGSFPIAYAVVEIESKQSWIWFLRLLIEDLKITNGLSYVFISDKQKGLIPAIETLLPTVEHR
ncbi:PREDICTED: LOC107462923 isoform, partial [Prunus dulcis]